MRRSGYGVPGRNLAQNDMMKRMQSEARKAVKTVARKATAGRSAYVMDGRGFVHVEQIKHKRNTDFYMS